ncbi:MAG: Adenosylcobinamide-GDP ribazoletransferase [Porticoccaceae bacterium UBA1117]|nr:adenosylcobinamide-GDP ribazoletransferase [Porticoccaceae bacterium]CAI8276497.1 MAG: Adenosylcobinamide-GDP ribazoletransferase [Porticoccaceae bacterium UBA1117]
MSFIKRELRAMACAVQFLSRVPVATKTIFEVDDYANSLAWYPLVGAFIGLIIYLSGAGLAGISSPSLIAALVLTIWVLLSGALHLDGVADCADAWVGGFGDRAKTLKILKDPASGPIAVVTLVLLLLLKWSALSIVIDSSYWSIIWVTPVLARSAMLLIFWRFDYVSSSGLGSPLAAGFSIRRIGFALLVVIIGVTSLLSGQSGLLLCLLGLTSFIIFMWKRSCYQHLGGFNGDCAGALIELLELGYLLGLALLVGVNS